MKKRTIILGIDSDGAPVQSGDPLCVNRMGPMAFLEFLEIHSGIMPDHASQIERIAAFMAVLQEHEGEFPFYAKSWENAPLAAARRMLQWIDTWYLHGWNGNMVLPDNFSNPSDACIFELSALDNASRNTVSPGTGRRLLEIADVLDEGICIPLTELQLADALTDWPAGWQRLFKALSCELETYNWDIAETGSGDTQTKEVVIWEYDCTVTAGRYLAAFAQDDEKSPHSKSAVILEAEGNLRDEILGAYGRPETGARESSSNDPASQILSLALALQKEPLDMNSLLAFLALPVCPLGGIRYRLAESVAESGGIYGPSWKEAIKKSEELWKKWEKDESTLKSFIDSWMPEKKQPENAFSKKTAIDTANHVLKFLKKSKLENKETPLAQAALFCEALELLGKSYTNLNWSIIEEILCITSVSTGSHSLNTWELGALRPWSTPGAAFEEIDTLIWFCPRNILSVSKWPWSESQKSLLEANDCRLQPINQSNSRLFRVTRRVLSRTKKKIILVVPTGRSELSPAELLLRYGKTTRPIADMSIEEVVLADSSENTKVVAETALPPVKHFWSIEADLSPGENWKTSYSQAHTFINRPAQWLLEKKARIQTGSILSLPDLHTLRGTCAHRMVEQLFKRFGDDALYLDEGIFLQWFEKIFPHMLENYAYPYLKTEAIQEKINFQNLLRSSIQVLRRYLRDAEAEQIKLEALVSGECFDASFGGSADLVFQKKNGEPGIIDMKYSTWTSGYEKKIEQDTDIQLTLYAELYRQTHGKLPKTAYWLFPGEILLTRHPDFFPGARIVHSEKSHVERLAMIGESISWRRAQLEQGLAEIVSTAAAEIGKTKENIALLPPEKGLPVEDPFDDYDPSVSFYGWSAEA